LKASKKFILGHVKSCPDAHKPAALRQSPIAIIGLNDKRIKGLAAVERRMKLRDWVGLSTMLLAGMAGAAYAAGDPVNGKKIFMRCAICHSVQPGKNMLGPSLAGIVGKPSASAPGFAYSSAMKSANIKWTPDKLDTYLLSPAKMVPGNRMAFAGLPNATDRADVIAYLAKPAP
jgi:cytochrome c